MSRHSKNNTSTSVFTYRERQMIKDYGTQKTRIGMDSCKKFDECTLCLLKAQDPQTCKEGHVFCKSCIIENLVEQKKEIAARQEKFQLFQEQEKRDQEKLNTQKEKEILENFEKIEDSRIQSTTDILKPKIKKITNYINWLPEDSGLKEKIEAPSTKLICPGDKRSEIKMKTVYPVDIKIVGNESVCHCCQKELGYQKMCLPKKCGHLVCKLCYDQSTKTTQSAGDKLVCAVCVKKYDKDDTIHLQQSFSSYSFHNNVESVKFSSTATI